MARPPRRRRCSLLASAPFSRPGGNAGYACGKRAPPYRSHAGRARASKSKTRLRTSFAHIGRRLAGGGPQGGAAALFSRQRPSPGPGGTRGTRGKRAPPYRSLAGRAESSHTILKVYSLRIATHSRAEFYRTRYRRKVTDRARAWPLRLGPKPAYCALALARRNFPMYTFIYIL